MEALHLNLNQPLHFLGFLKKTLVATSIWARSRLFKFILTPCLRPQAWNNHKPSSKFLFWLFRLWKSHSTSFFFFFCYLGNISYTYPCNDVCWSINDCPHFGVALCPYMFLICSSYIYKFTLVHRTKEHIKTNKPIDKRFKNPFILIS